MSAPGATANGSRLPPRRASGYAVVVFLALRGAIVLGCVVRLLALPGLGCARPRPVETRRRSAAG